MTAPTSDRAQQAVKELGNALHEMLYKQTAPMNVAYAIDTLITERLKSGQRATKDERDALKLIADTLTEVAPGWLIMSDAIRTLAQTAKDATARAEAAEAANMELDKERRSSDQSARDLRAENARLRAQLDAMTQREVRFVSRYCGEAVAKFDGTAYRVRTSTASATYESVDELLKGFPIAEPHRAALEALRHPSPAARVVGACVVRDGDVQSDSVIFALSQGRNEGYATAWADHNGGEPYELTLGKKLTLNADGAK